jgi:hypothetical protein
MTVPAYLQRRLQEKLGADAAKDLVKLLDRMDPLASAIEELRRDIRDMRRDMDARLKELELTLVGRFDTALERALRDQTRFFFLAWAVILATIIGLYARVP